MDAADEAAVVVPDAPGPIVALGPVEARRDRDGIDDLLDDVLGGVDDRGAGATDLVLVVGGGGLAAVAAFAGWPTWLVVAGLLAAALGAILPARSAWRRLRSARAQARRRALTGAGTVLVPTDPDVRSLVDLHARLLGEASTHGRRPRVVAVAHDALREVATLLDGRSDLSDDERGYVHDRVAALRDLVAAVDQVDGRDTGAGLGSGSSADDARRARLEARHEVDRLTGTATPGAARQLADELRDGRER